MDGEVTPEVKAFIRSTIDSVEQLEVLLFMMSNADKEWSADEVSARTRLTPEAAAARLTELLAARLLSQGGGHPPTYRYAPATAAIDAAVADSLDRAYRERRDTIIQLIYSRPLDNIRIFADAFRINKKDND